MIRLHGISKEYVPGRYALKGIDLQVDEGEFVVVTGPSGAGKTTLFRILSGEEQPTDGSALINGRNLSRLDTTGLAELRRDLGLVFADPRLIDRLTVLDNVALAAEVAGHSRGHAMELAGEMLEHVGVGDCGICLPRELSGGERQLVSLARALVKRPSLILADEPTLNLDPDHALDLIDILSEVCRQGTTVFMASHDMDVLSALQCRLLVMNYGRLQEDAWGRRACL